MPAGTIIMMTMSNDSVDHSPSPCGRGLGEGAAPNCPRPPPANPLPQGEGEKLLRLLTWLSPAFPTGAYAYSHGLEWAVECGDITDGDTLLAWLTDVLFHGSGRNDAILLRHAHRDGSDLAAVNELAAAITPSRERLTETLDQGAAFVAAAAAWHPPELPERVAYPVAVGALTGRVRHRRRHHHGRLSAGVRRQPDLGRSPPGAARPEHGAARSRRAGTDHSARRRVNTHCHARRPWRLRVPFRSRRHASRNPV